MSWFLAALSKYGTFQGRAQRAEYWYFTLFYLLLYFLLKVLDHALGTNGRHGGPGLLTFLFILGMIVPGFSVGVRRLHDTGRAGWWILINLIPFIGGLVFIFFAVQDSQPGANAYGPNPKGVVGPDTPPDQPAPTFLT